MEITVIECDKDSIIVLLWLELSDAFVINYYVKYIPGTHRINFHHDWGKAPFIFLSAISLFCFPCCLFPVGITGTKSKSASTDSIKSRGWMCLVYGQTLLYNGEFWLNIALARTVRIIVISWLLWEIHGRQVLVGVVVLKFWDIVLISMLKQ